jgi:hypothetical protein
VYVYGIHNNHDHIDEGKRVKGDRGWEKGERWEKNSRVYDNSYFFILNNCFFKIQICGFSPYSTTILLLYYCFIEFMSSGMEI